MQDHGFAPLAVGFTYQAIVMPTAFLLMVLPRAVVEIARLIRRHRRLAA